jgi:hypothetical protein
MSEDTGVPVAVMKRLQLALVGYRWDPDGWWAWGEVRLSDETVDRLEAARWEAVLQLARGGSVTVWN